MSGHPKLSTEKYTCIMDNNGTKSSLNEYFNLFFIILVSQDIYIRNNTLFYMEKMTKRVTLPAKSNLTSVYVRKQLTPLPKPMALAHALIV